MAQRRPTLTSRGRARRTGQVIQAWIVLCSATLLAACASGTGPPQPTDVVVAGTQASSPSPTVPADPCLFLEAWQLRLRMSGGIAGVDQFLELGSSGQLTTVGHAGQTRITGQLPPDEMEDIERALRKACPFTAVARQSVCADCFSYELEIEAGTQRWNLVLDDLTLPGTDLAPLISRLVELMQRIQSG